MNICSSRQYMPLTLSSDWVSSMFCCTVEPRLSEPLWSRKNLSRSDNWNRSDNANQLSGRGTITLRVVDNNYLCEMVTAPAFSCDETYSLDSVIRGHYVFKHVWTPFVGEILTLTQEHDYKYDRFAVTVQLKNSKKTIGRVPIEISEVFWNF